MKQRTYVPHIVPQRIAKIHWNVHMRPNRVERVNAGQF